MSTLDQRYFFSSTMDTPSKVMSRTLQPSFDISSEFPALRKKITVILHPRRTTEDLSVYSSKMGGHIYWPYSDPWPTCPFDGQPMIPVLQLTREELPELGFPTNDNMFQMLWCPNKHDKSKFGLINKCMWRRVDRNDNVSILAEKEIPVPGANADKFAVPTPCTFRPETVVEYPHFCEMINIDASLPMKVEHWIRIAGAKECKTLNISEDDDCYITCFSVSPSTKIGGYVDWMQNVDYPSCKQCGKRMNHLLSISSFEYGGYSYRRWLSAEKRLSDEANNHGMRLDGAGKFYLFVCRSCQNMPLESKIQFF